ncbi:MAG: monovalent cation/H+ antiporter subunit D family protein [Myxococcota bacterium]|nr:monovalent cation/H+ antiporter subunit D family protein [Myxococcota bacterium]
MIDHLPVLLVVLPLLAAPICLLLRNAQASRVLAIAVVWTSLLLSGKVLGHVLTEGSIIYLLGGWAAPYGIEFRVDALNAYLLIIVATIGSVVLPFGGGAAGLSVSRERLYLYYAAFLLCICGLLGISVTGDIFNIFVFLEITSLASYSLISLGQGRRALRAAFSYLVLGTIGGTFFLIGVGLLYQATGTLNLADLAALLKPFLAAGEGLRSVMVAFAFLVVGVGIKLAVFPLHQWLPNAYTYAPAKVSAFLAATATKVSFYVLLRIVFGVFGAAFVFGTLRLHYLLVPLSLLAMFVGSLAAIYQTDIKRLLAYSSIAQIGYMTLGLSTYNEFGLSGSVVHLFNHALMKGGLFLVVACVTYRIHSTRLEDWAGIGRRMPVTMAAFLVGGLSLIGLPGTVGFVSKWYLVLGALEAEWPLVAVLILLSSLLALVYVWKVVELAWFRDPPEGAETGDVSLSLLVPTWVLIGGTVFFGLNTELTLGVAREAVALLLGTAG